MTLRFVGGENLQRGRGLGGLLRLAKSVFSPIARSVSKAVNSGTGKSIMKALKQQAIDSSLNLATDALRGNNLSESFQNEIGNIRENAADNIDSLKRHKTKKKTNLKQRGRAKKRSRDQSGSGCRSKKQKRVHSLTPKRSKSTKKKSNIKRRTKQGLFD